MGGSINRSVDEWMEGQMDERAMERTMQACANQHVQVKDTAVMQAPGKVMVFSWAILLVCSPMMVCSPSTPPADSPKTIGAERARAIKMTCRLHGRNDQCNRESMDARTVQNIWKDDVDSEFLCRMKKH